MTDKELENLINPFKRSNYQINTIGDSLTLIAENNEERGLLEEIANTITNKIKRLERAGYDVKYLEDKEKDNLTLKKCFNKFYNLKEKSQNGKYLTKYRQTRDLLYMFFGENKNIRKIQPLDVVDFVDFMLSFPSDYKKIKELQGKDIKTLILKKSKILDRYSKVGASTIDEHIKKCKTLFNEFVGWNFIYHNPFNSIKKQATKKNTAKTRWLDFKPSILKTILNDTKIKSLEDYNLIKLGLYSGLRREELSILRVKDIDFNKVLIDFDYEIDMTKTENSKRTIPIHKDILELLEYQSKDKDERRGENIGSKINKIFGNYFNEKDKKHYNLHSLRKNFAQTIALNGTFTELELKTIIGHSTDSDTTDKHYLLGKRNWEKLKEKMDKVDFTDYFEMENIISNIKTSKSGNINI